MELEEAKKLLQNYIVYTNDKAIFIYNFSDIPKSIETVLKALEELQEENKLKKNRQGIGTIKEVNIENLSEVLSPYYIPKKVIEDKIKNLEEGINEYKQIMYNSRDRVEIRIMNDNINEFKYCINILQDLLKGEK